MATDTPRPLFGAGPAFPYVLIVRSLLGVVAGVVAITVGGGDAGAVEPVVRLVGGSQIVFALLLLWCGLLLHRTRRDVSLAVTGIEMLNIALLAVLPLSHVPEVLLSMVVLGALYIPGYRPGPLTTGENIRSGCWGLLVVPLTVAAFFLGFTVFGTDGITGKAQLDHASLRLALGFLCSAVAFASLSRLLRAGRS